MASGDLLVEGKGAGHNGLHAFLILDQVGWHPTAKLKILDNMTLLFLQRRSRELSETTS